MRDYNDFLEQVERVIQKYNQKINNKKDYGVDISLTQTEIHLIDLIGKHPGIGVKSIAEIKGVTAGAASQMIKKMVKKDLICKKISEESEAKIELLLTDKGKICFQNHKEYHEKANKKWFRLLDTLDDKSYESIIKIISQTEKLLNENHKL